MLLSAIAPLHDFPISDVLNDLRKCSTDLSNLGNGDAAAVLDAYQRWSTGAAEFLGYKIASDDIERLILTRRHWMLLEMVVAGNGPTVRDLIRAERTDRLRVFDGVIKALKTIEDAWLGVTAKVVAADTNVYLHHEQYFDQINWKALAGGDQVRLLVPMAVVRELDKCKQGPQNKTVSDTNKESIRTRARIASRLLRELMVDPKAVATLPTGVEVELLLDPLDHRRLDDTDSEIIDRVLTAKQLIGRSISMVTGDGGMQFTAATSGLGVIPLVEPVKAS
jgi:hypothetical protein